MCAKYLIVKTVGDFVSNYPSNSGIVQVRRTVLAEESTLQDTSWELCGWSIKKNMKLIYELFIRT